MNSQRLEPTTPTTVEALLGGVIVPTLAPFEEDDQIMRQSIADQASRLARIEGIVGIAVSTTIRERQSLSLAERLAVIEYTRKGLAPKQLVLACVGDLSRDVEEEVAASKDAGADAVITFPPTWRNGSESSELGTHSVRLTELVDRMPLPIIAALSEGNTADDGQVREIALLGRDGGKVVSVATENHDNALQYDEVNKVFKAVYQPLACLTTSKDELVHDLNTGADAVISCLAYIAPHEVAELYRTTRSGRFQEAQVLHKRLSPFTELISCIGQVKREMVLRQIVHRRGLLASTYARDLPETLGYSLARKIERTLNETALTRIAWV